MNVLKIDCFFFDGTIYL